MSGEGFCVRIRFQNGERICEVKERDCEGVTCVS